MRHCVELSENEMEEHYDARMALARPGEGLLTRSCSGAFSLAVEQRQSLSHDNESGFSLHHHDWADDWNGHQFSGMSTPVTPEPFWNI